MDILTGKFKLQLTAGLLVLKAAMFLLFIGFSNPQLFPGTIFLDSADRHEYIEPMNNLVDHGSFSLTPGGEPFAGRLPGFVFPYLLFRLVVGNLASAWLLGIFTLALSIVAALALASLVYWYTGRRRLVVIIVAAVHGLSYFWHWDFTLHPFSLGASALIIGLYFLEKHFRKGYLSDLFLSGVFFSWLAMLRGYTLPFLIIIAGVLLVYGASGTIKHRITAATVFLSSFFAVEGAWITRNYMALGQFIPLQTSFVPGADSPNSQYGYNSRTKYSMTKLRELINCWGGDNFWFFRNSDLKWFTDKKETGSAETFFSPSIFGGALTPRALDDLKTVSLASFEQDLSAEQRKQVDAKIISLSAFYRNEFMSHHSGYYYFVAPLNRFANFLLRNPTQDWPLSNGIPRLIELGVKSVSALLYLLLLVFFPIVLTVSWRRLVSDPLAFSAATFTICIIALFALVINAAHYTYFIYGYIPAVLMLVLLAGRKKSATAKFARTTMVSSE